VVGLFSFAKGQENARRRGRGKKRKRSRRKKNLDQEKLSDSKNHNRETRRGKRGQAPIGEKKQFEKGKDLGRGEGRSVAYGPIKKDLCPDLKGSEKKHTTRHVHEIKKGERAHKLSNVMTKCGEKGKNHATG